MKIQTHENIIANDHGETLVEVMVSFIVLMIVLALFSSTISFGSSSIMRSIDIRRTSDDEYITFRKTIDQESRTNVIPYNTDGDPNTMDCIRTSTNSKVETISTTDDSTVELTAYQYRSGDTIYWVFR